MKYRIVRKNNYYFPQVVTWLGFWRTVHYRNGEWELVTYYENYYGFPSAREAARALTQYIDWTNQDPEVIYSFNIHKIIGMYEP